MTLKVDEAWFNTQRSQDGTREFAPCTAWVNFNGAGTVAILDALNVSSITDNGTGEYTVNFSQLMDNANYSQTMATSREFGDIRSYTVNINLGGSAVTTSEFDVIVRDDEGTNSDRQVVSVQVFGGVA